MASLDPPHYRLWLLGLPPDLELGCDEPCEHRGRMHSPGLCDLQQRAAAGGLCSKGLPGQTFEFLQCLLFFFGHGSEINIFSSSGIHSFNPKLLIRGSSPPPLMSGWSRLCGHRRKRAQGRVIGEEVSRAFAPWSTSLCAHFIASSQISPVDLQKWVFFIISWYYFSSFLCDTRNGHHFLMIFELRLLYL